MADEDNNPTPQPSDRFAEDLGAIYRSDIPVPRSIDDAIANRARAHFAGRRSRRLILRIGALATAAAAVIVIAVHLAGPDGSRQLAPVAINNDVKDRGAVDIVDALKLARRIRMGQAVPRQDDINHDGTVDSRDVDAIAMVAVKLPDAKMQ